MISAIPAKLGWLRALQAPRLPPAFPSHVKRGLSSFHPGVADSVVLNISVSGSPELKQETVEKGIDLFERGVTDMLAMRSRPWDQMEQATLVTGTNGLWFPAQVASFIRNGREFLNDAPVQDVWELMQNHNHDITEQEAYHMAAMQQWRDGYLSDATATWEGLLSIHPKDVIAIRLLHEAYIHMGDSISLLESIQRVLPDWSSADYCFGWVLGMHSFALGENNKFDHATEEAGRATKIDVQDMWATMSIANTFQLRKSHREGLRLIRETEDQRRFDHSIQGHFLWYKALYQMDNLELIGALLSGEEARHIGGIRDEDFAALLWRLKVNGIDEEIVRETPTGRLWEQTVASTTSPNTGGSSSWFSMFSSPQSTPTPKVTERVASEGMYGQSRDGRSMEQRFDDLCKSVSPKLESPATNLWHVVCKTMIFTSSSNGSGDLVLLLNNLESALKKAHSNTSLEDTPSKQIVPIPFGHSPIGQPYHNIESLTVALNACRGIAAYQEGRMNDCVSHLFPFRHKWNLLGGSRVQREALQDTLLSAALIASGVDVVGDGSSNVDSVTKVAEPVATTANTQLQYVRSVAKGLLRVQITDQLRSPRLWVFLAKYLASTGDDIGADISYRRALDLGLEHGRTNSSSR